MSQTLPSSPSSEFDRADFKGLYKGGSLVESASIRVVPWEIGRAQPAIHAILEDAPRGRLLDVGCGLGHNANAARDLGFDVVAIDSSKEAIERCWTEFSGHGIEFLVADACDTGLAPASAAGSGFDVILDSALYHAIPAADRARYLKEMRRLAGASTVMHVVTFSPSPHGMPMPLSIALSEIAVNAESAGWAIRAVGVVEYRGNAEAIADFQKKKNLKIRLDDEGMTRLPCWHVTLHPAP